MERVVVAKPDGTPVAEYEDFTLDATIGDEGNDFGLVLPNGAKLGRGWLWWIDGTEWGGTVDAAAARTTKGDRRAVWQGRTWAGVLESRILCPDAGKNYLTAHGDASDELRRIIARAAAGGVCAASAKQSGIEVEHTYARYVDAWTGIRSMLRENGARVDARWSAGRAVLGAVPAADYGSYMDDDLLDFDIVQQWRCTNHLVCLGVGELAARTVIHLYADEAGDVSRTQTLYGADEMADTYDYSNAEAADLEEKGIERLREMQTKGSVGVSVKDEDVVLMLGDTVRGRDNVLGVDVTGEVVQKTIRYAVGAKTVEYEIGSPKMTGSLSETAEAPNYREGMAVLAKAQIGGS